MKILLTLFLAFLGSLMVLKALIGVCSGSIHYYTQVLPGWPKQRSDILTRIEDGGLYWSVCLLYFIGGAGLITFVTWFSYFR